MPSTTEHTARHRAGGAHQQQSWGPPRSSPHAKRPMKRNSSDSDFYLGPVGSFAGDSPPGRRPAHASAPLPAHEEHYRSHASLPPSFLPPQPPFHDMYHHPQHMYHSHPPPYPYGYPNQFAYPIHPPPQGAPLSGDGWTSPPGTTPPKESPHRRYGRPTPDKDLESPHLNRDGTMSFDPNIDDSDTLVGRLSPLGSDFLGKFEEASTEPVHVEHFRMGFPSEPQLGRINHMLRPPLAPVVQRPPPFPKPVRVPTPPVIPTPPPLSMKKKSGGCTCKKTKCLKLYCECFASKKYCVQGCKCTDCHNNEEHSAQRDEAIKNILGRNQSAFESTEGIACRCKRSACLKKYCECFGSGRICGKDCKCINCENRAGSQTLIDKRRRMNDQTGARYAMELAASIWEKPKPKPTTMPKRPLYAASPSHNSFAATMQQHSMSPIYYQRPAQYPSPGFPHHMRAPQHYISHHAPLPTQTPHNPTQSKRLAREITPGTPRIRASKKRAVCLEPSMMQLFGKHSVSKRTFCHILEFLADGDKQTASQVSMQWNAVTAGASVTS